MKNIKSFLEKVFGQLNITWPKLIIFSLIMAIYTALVAMLAPDGNSLHDIAVTPEWWVLPAIIIIVNSKKPLEAALKTFVFFLISQPLVYVFQIPFSPLHWDILKFYPYWFGITLLTFPAAFIGWFIKKDKWYSGLILSAMTVLLAVTGGAYVKNLIENPPNHLISIIYCFVSCVVFILVILKSKAPRILATVITLIALVIFCNPLSFNTPYEFNSDSVLEDNGITLVGEPHITNCDETQGCSVELIESGDIYVFRVKGIRGREYRFTVVDDENEYNFTYRFDEKQKTVVIEAQE